MRVIGKYDVADHVLRAVAIFVESEEIVGELWDIEDASGGKNLLIKEKDGNERTVFLPEGTPVYLQGDGEVSLELLNYLLDNCGPKEVRVALDPAEAEPTAQEVRVQQERLFGQVVDILMDRVVRLRSGKLVKIQPGATILLNTSRADIPVDFDQIRVGDKLTLYGLEACTGLDVDFYAFVVLINESATDCDSEDCHDDVAEDCRRMDQLPGSVTANNVKICLEPGAYNNRLAIERNNFTLIGTAGSSCSSGGWTELKGPVVINGNNATFKNIKFSGAIDEKGNNTRFINSCY